MIALPWKTKNRGKLIWEFPRRIPKLREAQPCDHPVRLRLPPLHGRGIWGPGFSYSPPPEGYAVGGGTITARPGCNIAIRVLDMLIRAML